MSTHRSFCRLALASTMVLAACSSDTPTSPTAASQALAVAAPTISLSTTAYHLCYPAHLIPTGTRPYWCYPHSDLLSGLFRDLYIINSGGGTLNWTSSKSATWIKRSQTSGTAPSRVKVSVDGTGLPRGIYYGTIKVWARGATNSPQTVLVSMQRY